MKRDSFVFLLIITTILSACVEDLPVNNKKSDNIAVLNCVLTDDSVQHLSLSRSNTIDGSLVFKEITKADAQLFENGKSVGKFVRKGFKDWQLPFTPTAGKSYTISIELPDTTYLTASTTMPEACDFTADEEEIYRIHFTQSSFNSPVWICVLKSDSLIYNTASLSKANFFSDIGTDHPLADTFNEGGDMHDLIPNSNTQSFEFYIRLRTAEAGHSPVNFYIETLLGSYGAIVFRTASYEYDRYMKTSFQKMLLYEDEDDPIQWFDESTVYSNVKGGTGIFAACNDEVFCYNE